MKSVSLTIVSILLFFMATGMGYSQAVYVRGDEKPESKVSGFKVDPVLGLGKDSRFDLPYPFVVRVKNTSGRDFDGALKITFASDSSEPPVSLPVNIPNNSNKIYRLCLKLNQYSSINISFVDSGDVFWKQTLTANSRDETTNRNFSILVIDQAMRPFNVLRTGNAQHVKDQWNTMHDRRKVNPNCETLPSWCLPVHDSPLYSFDAIIFSTKSQTTTLTAEQVTALAKYIEGGGTVVVPSARSNLKERLIKSLPLPITRSAISINDSLTKQIVGRGMIMGYDGILYPLDNSSGTFVVNKLQLAVVDQVATMPNLNFPSGIINAYNYRADNMSTRGGISILVVISMFLLYTIVIGPFTFLFRKNKLKMAMFLGISILSFVVLSVFCGIFLRNRKGDMNWVTVTELTPDGGIQIGGLTLKSCAGQKHDLTLEPPSTELLIHRSNPRESYRRYSYQPENSEMRRSNASFTILPDATQDDGPLEVPLAPWGQGQVISRDYLPKLKRLKLDLNIVEDESYKKRFGKRVINGKTITPKKKPGNLGLIINGTLTNTLDVPLEQVEVILQVYSAHTNQYGYGSSAAHINTVSYIVSQVGNLKPGQSSPFRRRLIYSPQYNYYNRDTRIRFDYEKDQGSYSVLLPKLNQRDKLFAVILGRVKKSPSIKPGDSDFVIGKGSHFIMQTLLADDLPVIGDHSIDAETLQQPVPVNLNSAPGNSW